MLRWNHIQLSFLLLNIAVALDSCHHLLDRLLVLHLHMKYSAIVTKCRVCILIAVLWLLGTIFGSMFDWAVDAQNTVFVCANTMALLIALLSYVRIFQIVRYHRKQISIQLSEVSFSHRDEDNSVCTSFYRKDSTSKQWEDAMSEEMDGNGRLTQRHAIYIQHQLKPKAMRKGQTMRKGLVPQRRHQCHIWSKTSPCVLGRRQ